MHDYASRNIWENRNTISDDIIWPLDRYIIDLWVKQQIA